MTNTTKFQAAARQIKASRMATTLLAQAPAADWFANGIVDAPPAFWLITAQQAGVATALRGTIPSPATVAIVVDQLRADALFAGSAVA